MDNNEFVEQSKNIVQKFKEELLSIRTNRPTPALVENIIVECYEQKMPIKQIGSIGILPPREIRIQVWDKDIIENLISAISSSPLGISASADGMVVRVNLPELSVERREELVKHIKKESERFRIQLRTLREDHNKKIQKSDSNQDEQSRLKKGIQSATDDANKMIEEALERKIAEIRE